MPVRMTEIIPQTPSGVAKINVDIGDILTESNFDAELDLLELIPSEMPAESRDFTQVGQILREMILLEVQTKRAIPEPPNIDVEQPTEKSPAAEVAPDVSQQMVIAPSTTPATIAPTKNAENSGVRRFGNNCSARSSETKTRLFEHRVLLPGQFQSTKPTKSPSAKSRPALPGLSQFMTILI